MCKLKQSNDQSNLQDEWGCIPAFAFYEEEIAKLRSAIVTAVRERPDIIQTHTAAASMCSGEQEAVEIISGEQEAVGIIERDVVPKERETKRGGWAERVVELIERWNAGHWRACGDLVDTWTTMPTIQKIMTARRW